MANVPFSISNDDVHVVAIRDSSWTVLSSTLPPPFLTITVFALTAKLPAGTVDALVKILTYQTARREGGRPLRASTRPAAVTRRSGF